MALLFCDSFDHYTTVAQAALKWTSSVDIVIGASGRNSTNGIRFGGNGPSQNTKTLVANYATLIAGTAWKLNTNSTDAKPILAFADVATNQMIVQCNASTLKLEVRRNGTLLNTGATVLSAATFYYVEFKVAFATGVTGSYEVRLNGVTEVSGSSVQTAASGNAYANVFSIGGPNGGNTNQDVTYDDLYLCDNSGANNTDFLGDVRVQYLIPNGAGGNTQWTPSAGSNYQNVDETTPNDDTDYNSDGTVGDRDTYTLGNLSPSTASIKGIQTITYARKDDAGTRTIAPVLYIGGTNYDQASLPNLTTSYQYLNQILEVSPATTIAFTLSEVNGMESGVKVIA